MLWGALEVIDYVNQELEEGPDVVQLCRSSSEMDEALREGKHCCYFGPGEGGRPLEGRPMYDSLSILRGILSFRSAFVATDRKRTKSPRYAVAESGPMAGLTQFGVAVVKEMNRLGMMIYISRPRSCRCV